MGSLRLWRCDVKKTPIIQTPMHALLEIRTERLLLRRWRAGDREPFAKMNAEPRVMEFFPALLTADQSDELIERIEAHFEQRGFGLWAVEVPTVLPFAGFIGLSVPRFSAHFTPCVEIGWRLSADVWGRGYATEGAQAVVTAGFQSLGLREIVSFAAVENLRSRRVMERIGMVRDAADDFDHPDLPNGHRLQRHVLYRLRPSCCW
jgi:RimJ/RimL family protein N-acetyltransferase